MALMTFDVYDTLVQLERSSDGRSLSSEQTEEYRRIIRSIGPNYRILKYLMNFLVNEVSVHADENKMIPSNIGIVFGPTLMRPRVETMVILNFNFFIRHY